MFCACACASGGCTYESETDVLVSVCVYKVADEKASRTAPPLLPLPTDRDAEADSSAQWELPLALAAEDSSSPSISWRSGLCRGA